MLETLHEEASHGTQAHKPCGAQHCVGCPAIARNVLPGLLGDSTEGCGFDSVPLDMRAMLPASWLSKYSFAMVRRGYVIRQRTDAAGRTTAVDAVGPGCCFPVDRGSADGRGSVTSGYAVSRALLCLCEGDGFARSLEAGGKTALQVHQLDSEAIVRMERLADARGRAGTASKVAALLCTLSDTLRPATPRESTIPSEFLQRDFAALLSIRHESVCRVLRDLGEQGLVKKSPDGLQLVDRTALEAI